MRFNFKILCLSLFINVSAFGFDDVNFSHSNGFDLMREYSAQYLNPNANIELNLLRNNYERLKPSKTPSNPSPIIPKTIHQIWLGKSPMPKNYQYFLETWRQHHPDWQIKVWNQEDILKENFPNIDLFFLARSYAEQADIARYEIIYRYGGLYVDTDIECFTNFDELHHKYDFYINMEPPALNKKQVTIANNMIAAVPNHPILERTLLNIRSNWNLVEEEFENNLSNSWTSFRRSNHNLAVQRTMYPLSDAVFSFLTEEDQAKYKSIVLPSGYNIPIYFVNNRPILNFLSNTFRGRAKLSNKIEIRPETMSFHFYDKQNSLMNYSSFSSAIFEKSKIKGWLYKLLKFRDKYYLAFRDLFNRNFPANVEYSVEATIPKVIYLERGNLPKQHISSLKEKWQELNPGFKVQIVDSDYLQQFIPAKMMNINKKALKVAGKFYLLRKKGGLYVGNGFEPVKLNEFHHKYGYYGKFSKLHKIFDSLKISTNLMAFSSNHSILNHLIKDIESEVLKNSEVTEDMLQRIYLDNAYKYYQLDGKSIILPEIFFNQKR